MKKKFNSCEMKARNVYFFSHLLVCPSSSWSPSLFCKIYGEWQNDLNHICILLFIYFLMPWEWYTPRGMGFDSFANALRDCGLNSLKVSLPSVLHDVLHCPSDLAMQLPCLTGNTVLEVPMLTEILHQLPETLSGPADSQYLPCH